MEALLGAIKSKTIWFSMLLAALGVLEQSKAVLTTFIGAGNIGYVMLVISLATALLRVFTTAALAKK